MPVDIKRCLKISGRSTHCLWFLWRSFTGHSTMLSSITLQHISATTLNYLCHVTSSGSDAGDHLSPSSSILCCHLHLPTAVSSDLYSRYSSVSLFSLALQLVTVWSSHKWTGTASGTSVIWTWSKRTESGTRYTPALDLPTVWQWKYRIHALTIRRCKKITLC